MEACEVTAPYQINILAADEIEYVSAEPGREVVRLHFVQGETHAALEFSMLDAERVAKALAATLMMMARERGMTYAREVLDLELQANLDGATLLVLESDQSESIHLSPEQMAALRDSLDTILRAQAAQSVQ